jgi:stage II sporulation protein AA (anti-sigma F factor antagonist)
VTNHGRAKPSSPATASGAGLDVTLAFMTHGQAAVCILGGALHHDNEEHVTRALFRAVEQGPALLGVDLSAVDLLASSGLKALLAVERHGRALGVEVVVIAPSPHARRILRITEVDTVLRTAATLEEALRESGSEPDGVVR